MIASTPLTTFDTAARMPSEWLTANAELATSVSALLLMAGAVLAESSEEGRMAPYDLDWLQLLINNLESFGGTIAGLADAASLITSLPRIPRAH